MAGFASLPAVAAVLAAAAVALALALLLAAVDFSNRVHRAFALLVLLQSLSLATLAFSGQYDDLAGRLHAYAFIAVPFAAVHFAYVYRRRYRAQRDRRWLDNRWALPLAVVAGAAVAETAYLLDHGLLRTAADYGPLVVFAFLAAPSYAAIALLFARDYRKETSASHRRALFLAAFGMSLDPLFQATFRMSDLALDAARGVPLYPDFLLVAESIAYGACLILAVAVIAILSRRGPDGASPARRWYPLWALAVGSGVAVAILVSVGGILGCRGCLGTILVMRALWSIALPLLVTYALIRHRLFDTDLHVRFAVKGTTLGAIAIAVFFAVSEISAVIFQKLFEDTFLRGRAGGAIFGILAASVVVFALHPVQRLADRLVQRAVEPAGRLSSMSHPERVNLFREQLEIAWGDGTLTTKERILFERLRHRLGLTAEEVLQLESKVVAAVAPAARSGKAGAAPS